MPDWLAHPTPYSLHHAPYSILPTPYPAPYTLHPTPYTLHPTPYTLHPTPYTLHPTPYTQGTAVDPSMSPTGAPLQQPMRLWRRQRTTALCSLGQRTVTTSIGSVLITPLGSPNLHQPTLTLLALAQVSAHAPAPGHDCTPLLDAPSPSMQAVPLHPLH